MKVYTFELFGLKLQEPSTFITDLMLTILCIILWSKTSKKTQFSINFKLFFLSMALCTFLGGLGHLFYHYFGITGKGIGWIFSILSNLFVARAIISIFPIMHQQPWNNLVLIKSSVLLLAALISQKFLFVAIDVTFTLFFFCWYIIRDINATWKKPIVWAFLIMLPSSIFIAFKIDLHIHFNRLDVGHFFMFFSILFFFRAVTLYDNESNSKT